MVWVKCQVLVGGCFLLIHLQLQTDILSFLNQDVQERYWTPFTSLWVNVKLTKRSTVFRWAINFSALPFFISKVSHMYLFQNVGLHSSCTLVMALPSRSFSIHRLILDCPLQYQTTIGSFTLSSTYSSVLCSHTNQYLVFDSFHPIHQKMGWWGHIRHM